LQTTQAEDILQIVDMESYLTSEIGETAFNGVVFCAYNVIFAEQDDYKIVTYLWVLCQEYYQEQQALEPGTGISLPIAVFIRNKNNNFNILNYRFPRDGINYEQDIKDIFPKSVLAKIIPSNSSEIDNFNERIKNLEMILKDNAQEYFNIEDR
jgi:hypothetical protein